MRIGSARVSTSEQSCTLQREVLEQSGCGKYLRRWGMGRRRYARRVPPPSSMGALGIPWWSGAWIGWGGR